MSPAGLRVLARVDGGFCHSLTRSALSAKDRPVADALVDAGLLRVEARRGRFPKRFVVTNHGIHSWETFRMFADLGAEVWRWRRAPGRVAA